MLYTINHVLNTEARLEKLMSNAYGAVAANSWWRTVMCERPGEGSKQEFEWLLSQAEIYRLNSVGDGMRYDDMITQGHSVTHEDFGAGLKIKRNQFEDDEFQFAGDWATQMGSRIALDPQYECIRMITQGETLKAYDLLPYYAKNRPVNPQLGTGGPAGAYDNLIDDMNDVDSVTFPNNATNPELNAANLVALIAYIKTINPRTRHLQPKILRVPPQLEKVALELTNAAFIGATENVIRKYQLEVLVVDELGTSPKTWYLDCLVGETPGLLPFVRFIRRGYEMTSYTGMTQAELARSNQLEWHVRWRYGYMYGHPYQSFKVKGAGP